MMCTLNVNVVVFSTHPYIFLVGNDESLGSFQPLEHPRGFSYGILSGNYLIANVSCRILIYIENNHSGIIIPAVVNPSTTVIQCFSVPMLFTCTCITPLLEIVQPETMSKHMDVLSIFLSSDMQTCGQD